VTIIALWEEDGVTVSGLGEKLFLESNTLTPILKKLEGMGYVERLRDAEDERIVRVYLTKSGRRLREKALSINLDDAVGLTPKEFSTLQKEIVGLRGNLLKALGRGE
jgi:DNA-binding MarR family transcriptional regulator